MLSSRSRILIVLLAIAVQGPSPAFAEPKSFSQYEEQRSTALFQQLPQWQSIIKQLRAESEMIEKCRRSGDCTDQVARRMVIVLEELSSESRLKQINGSHDFVNQQPYREDERQFGRPDVWLSPLSFGAQGGDCEDYAIANYLMLSLLGFADKDLRMVVMTNRRAGQVHAVLLVLHDETWLVLDNRETEPRSVLNYRDWVPRYAVSAAQAWRYVPYKGDVQTGVSERVSPISPAAGKSFHRMVPGRE